MCGKVSEEAATVHTRQVGQGGEGGTTKAATSLPLKMYKNTPKYS